MPVVTALTVMHGCLLGARLRRCANANLPRRRCKAPNGKATTTAGCQDTTALKGKTAGRPEGLVALMLHRTGKPAAFRISTTASANMPSTSSAHSVTKGITGTLKRGTIPLAIRASAMSSTHCSGVM